MKGINKVCQYSQNRNGFGWDYLRDEEHPMRLWWGRDVHTWGPILEFQFNFYVVMHFFRICYAQLDATEYWHRYFWKANFAKFTSIETGLDDYIQQIETRQDYKEETGGTNKWLLNYTLQYTQHIWAELHATKLELLITHAHAHQATGVVEQTTDLHTTLLTRLKIYETHSTAGLFVAYILFMYITVNIFLHARHMCYLDLKTYHDMIYDW